MILLQKHWEALTGLYTVFQDRAPVMELDVASGQIRAWPAAEYLEILGDRTREAAKRQYKRVVAEGALLVFVRDEPKRILRSYLFAAEEIPSRREKSKEGRRSAAKVSRKAKVESSPRAGNGEISAIRSKLQMIYSRHRRRYRGNPDSGQLCCMWSTNRPPDVIADTAPILDIEAAFDIGIDEREAINLYDMELDEAARRIFELQKKHG